MPGKAVISGIVTSASISGNMEAVVSEVVAPEDLLVNAFCSSNDV